MRRAVLALVLAGCHVVSQVENRRPGHVKIVHHPDKPSAGHARISVGEAAALHFVEPLECPTEQIVAQQNSVEVVTSPNVATFVVGMLASAAGAILLARGAFGKDAPFAVAGTAGLAVGLPFAVGPWLGTGRELREGVAVDPITTPGAPEPCGERPLAAKAATISVRGLELEGTVDATGRFSISPFSVIDAFDAATLPPWDMVVTLDGGPSFTQLIPGGELSKHANEFLSHLDVDTRIAPMRLVPGLVPGLLRVSLTSIGGKPVLRVVLPIENKGPGDATALRGQITTRLPALDGRMLYIGAIRKGDVISRELFIPITPVLAAVLRNDPLDFSIELRDGHGTAPTTPIRFRGVVMAEAPR